MAKFSLGSSRTASAVSSAEFDVRIRRLTHMPLQSACTSPSDFIGYQIVVIPSTFSRHS